MQARYYDPVIGRFYSNDPIGFRDIHSFNRYAYVNNNPYKYIDPTGMCNSDPMKRSSTCSSFSFGSLKSKGNTDAAIQKVQQVAEKMDTVVNDAIDEVGEITDEITPNRETAHLAGSIASPVLGILSVTPYCGPICGYAALTIDGAIATDLAMQGDVPGAILTMAPAALSANFKAQMHARKTTFTSTN